MLIGKALEADGEAAVSCGDDILDLESCNGARKSKLLQSRRKGVLGRVSESAQQEVQVLYAR